MMLICYNHNTEDIRASLTYLFMNEKFHIQNLIDYLRAYVKGCHICWFHKNEKLQPKQLYQRINPHNTDMIR